MKIYPLIFAILLAVLSGLQSRYLPLLSLNVPVLVMIIGWGFIVIAVGMIGWSGRHFRQRNTTLDPYGTASHLAQQGLYRYSRHPMYLGMLLGLTGWALLLGDALAFLSPAIFFMVINYRVMPDEESVLIQIFGEEYQQYRSRVRRWL